MSHVSLCVGATLSLNDFISLTHMNEVMKGNGLFCSSRYSILAIDSGSYSSS